MARNAVTIFIDESGDPNAQSQTKFFAVGAAIVKDPPTLSAMVLQARQDWKAVAVTPEDRKAIDRGYFHARNDSSETRKFFLSRIAKTPMTVEFLWYDTTTITDQRATSEKKLHHHTALTLLAPLTNWCHQAHIVASERQKTMTQSILDDVVKQITRSSMEHHVQVPAMPFVYTKYGSVSIREAKAEPILDVVDYVLWAFNRKRGGDPSFFDQLHVNFYTEAKPSSPGGGLPSFVFASGEVAGGGTDREAFFGEKGDSRWSPTAAGAYLLDHVDSELAKQTADPLYRDEVSEARRLFAKYASDSATDDDMIRLMELVVCLLDSVPLAPQATSEEYRFLRYVGALAWLERLGILAPAYRSELVLKVDHIKKVRRAARSMG